MIYHYKTKVYLWDVFGFAATVVGRIECDNGAIVIFTSL